MLSSKTSQVRAGQGGYKGSIKRKLYLRTLLRCCCNHRLHLQGYLHYLVLPRGEAVWYLTFSSLHFSETTKPHRISGMFKIILHLICHLHYYYYFCASLLVLSSQRYQFHSEF